MEILRVPPYPITTTWNLPDNNYPYIVYVEDLIDHSVEETTITSSSTGVVTYILPVAKVQFDRQFLIRFYDEDHEHIIQESNLDIVRPYVNPSSLAVSGTATEIAEYTKYELIARSLVDTYTGIGFYNHKSILQVEGNGLDYMPVWRDANRVLKVYENNALVYNAEDSAIVVADIYNTTLNPTGSAIALTLAETHGFSIGEKIVIAGFTPTTINGTYQVQEVLDDYSFSFRSNVTDSTGLVLGTVKRVWDSAYKVTLDNSAIQQVFTGQVNLLEATLPSLPISRGDIWVDSRRVGMFPNGYDYIFVLDEGFRAIPADVEKAVIMLIDDLKCGRLDYYQRYVTSYNTDQFRIQFDKSILDGTGNVIVDKILNKYMKSITKIGVL